MQRLAESSMTITVKATRDDWPHMKDESKVWTFQMEDGATTDTVKANIQDSDGINPDLQRLVFAGRDLADGVKLEDSKVGFRSELLLKPRGFRLRLSYIGGFASVVGLADDQTIDSLKSKIAEVIPTPAEQQRLFPAGENAPDKEIRAGTLADNGLTAAKANEGEITIQVIVRLG